MLMDEQAKMLSMMHTEETPEKEVDFESLLKMILTMHIVKMMQVQDDPAPVRAKEPVIFGKRSSNFAKFAGKSLPNDPAVGKTFGVSNEY